MIRLGIGLALLVWIGATLVLAEFRWFNRVSLVERIRPYTARGALSGSTSGVLSVASFRGVIEPIAASVAERISSLFGVDDELETRLTRIHSSLDPSAFRTRQVGWSAAAFGAALLISVALAITPLAGLVFVLAAPLLTFLMIEQRIVAASNDWQRRIFLELPVTIEQIGMLLGAGYSLSAALSRIASRGDGAIARDLRRVLARVHHGLSEVDALREWGKIARIDELDRLIAVLALNREAGDLDALIGEEAKSTRREAQRDLLETIERRAQQVWIPVTVATLLPGVLFMAVPFLSALSLWGGTTGVP